MLLLNPLTNNPPGSLREPVQTNWALCALCQKKHKDRLKRPKGYEEIEEKIITFHKL